MLYGLVGSIEFHNGLLGCIEILQGLVGRIENLYCLVREKLLRIVQAFQYTTKQSRLKIKDEKPHSAVLKCYMAYQAVQKSYMAQQAVQKIYMAQYVKSFHDQCRHFNILPNNQALRFKTKNHNRPYRNAIRPSRLFRNPIWPSRPYRKSIWPSRPYRKSIWPST